MYKNGQVAESKNPVKWELSFCSQALKKDDAHQLHAIMMFSDTAVLQVFGSDDELTEISRQGGAVKDGCNMTPTSNNYFTNYPDAFIQHYIA